MVQESKGLGWCWAGLFLVLLRVYRFLMSSPFKRKMVYIETQDGKLGLWAPVVGLPPHHLDRGVPTRAKGETQALLLELCSVQ